MKRFWSDGRIEKRPTLFPLETVLRQHRATGRYVGIPPIFPDGSAPNGEGVNLTVHFTKKQGAPVQYVGGDDPAAAAAVREIDLRKKFHLQATHLADKVGLSPPKAKVLRAHLGIDEDPSCTHVFEFGSQKIRCFSDNAVAKMKAALTEVDINELWANRKNTANGALAAG